MSFYSILNLDACNQKCLFCMKSEQIESGHKINFTEARKFIEEAKRKGCTHIDFYGGEPTCFPFLKKAVKLSNDYGMNVSLATNAIKFASKRYADEFFRGIKVLGVSPYLHSHKPQVHNFITQVPGSFNKTISGIRNILRNRQRLSVTVVINALNRQEIAGTVKLIYKLGVRRIKFSGMSFSGRALVNSWLALGSKEILPNLKRGINVARNLGFSVIEVEKIERRLLGSREFRLIKFLRER